MCQPVIFTFDTANQIEIANTHGIRTFSDDYENDSQVFCALSFVYKLTGSDIQLKKKLKRDADDHYAIFSNAF